MLLALFASWGFCVFCDLYRSVLCLILVQPSSEALLSWHHARSFVLLVWSMLSTSPSAKYRGCCIASMLIASHILQSRIAWFDNHSKPHVSLPSSVLMQNLTKPQAIIQRDIAIWYILGIGERLSNLILCLAVCVCAVLGRASGSQADGLASRQLPVPCQHTVCHVCTHQPDGLHLVVHCRKRRSRSFLAHRSWWAYYALPLVITKSTAHAAWKLRYLALIRRASGLKEADNTHWFLSSVGRLLRKDQRNLQQLKSNFPRLDEHFSQSLSWWWSLNFQMGKISAMHLPLPSTSVLCTLPPPQWPQYVFMPTRCWLRCKFLAKLLILLVSMCLLSKQF